MNYLFCDKTGTLTKNELVFKKWSCAGIEEPEKSIEMDSQDGAKFENFLRCITLCHDVLILDLPNAQGVEERTKSGSSQDELCFLNMVEEKGIA